MNYTITGIFAVETEAADTRTAKDLASQRLKEAGIKHCVIEVRESAEEKPKRPSASETKAAVQD